MKVTVTLKDESLSDLARLQAEHPLATVGRLVGEATRVGLRTLAANAGPKALKAERQPEPTSPPADLKEAFGPP